MRELCGVRFGDGDRYEGVGLDCVIECKEFEGVAMEFWRVRLEGVVVVGVEEWVWHKGSPGW